MRHPLSTDCSRWGGHKLQGQSPPLTHNQLSPPPPLRAIIDWAESESRAELSPRLDHFQSTNMADAKFEHLSFRIGYPYLYCHHRNCEHIVIFKDIRSSPQEVDARERWAVPWGVSTYRKQFCVGLCRHRCYTTPLYLERYKSSYYYKSTVLLPAQLPHERG